MFSLVSFFCCVMILVSQVGFGIPMYLEEVQPYAGVICGDLKKFCACGTGPLYVSVAVKMCPSIDSNTNKSTCKPCDGFQHICEKYEHCASCSSESCTSCPQSKIGKFCNENAGNNELLLEAAFNSTLPIRFRIPRGDPNNHRRVLRAKTGCDLPPLKTAELNCVKYDYKVTCDQICIWGYRLRSGNNAKSHECTYRQKYWTPDNMEECEQVVDCEVELISKGTLSCITSRVDAADECTIGCASYDEVDNAGYVAEAKYVCDKTGVYSPSLPYCAEMNRTAFFRTDFY